MAQFYVKEAPSPPKGEGRKIVGVMTWDNIPGRGRECGGKLGVAAGSETGSHTSPCVTVFSCIVRSLLVLARSPWVVASVSTRCSKVLKRSKSVVETVCWRFAFFLKHCRRFAISLVVNGWAGDGVHDIWKCKNKNQNKNIKEPENIFSTDGAKLWMSDP